MSNAGETESYKMVHELNMKINEKRQQLHNYINTLPENRIEDDETLIILSQELDRLINEYMFCYSCYIDY